MFSLPIIRSRKTDSGVIEQIYFDPKAPNEEAKRHFASVRVGVCWPETEVKGAVVVLGQGFDRDFGDAGQE